MRIKMLSSEKGSDDGMHTNLYEEDKVYNVGEDLGTVFLGMGVAEETNEEETEDPSEEFDEFEPTPSEDDDEDED